MLRIQQVFIIPCVKNVCFGWKDTSIPRNCSRIFRKILLLERRTFKCEPRKLITFSIGRPRSLLGALCSAAVVSIPSTGNVKHSPRNMKHLQNENQSPSFLQILFRGMRIFMRFVRLFVTFLPVIFLCPLIVMGDKCRKLWWSVLLTVIENSGPIFIKLGQWASTRRDLFPKEFCQLFSRLQRNVAPHSWFFTVNQLDTSFGPEWRTFILKFDNDRAPIGSGCVAQVYKAYLRLDSDTANPKIAKIYEKIKERRAVWKTKMVEALEYTGFFQLFGTRDAKLDEAMQSWEQDLLARFHVNETYDEYLVPVAIKVLHPSIRSLLYKDLVIMTVAAKFLESIFPRLQWLNLTRCVQEFAELMTPQVNLIKEAENMALFAEGFKNIPWIKFARPIPPFITEDVLIETFEEGQHVQDVIMSEEYNEHFKKQLGEYGAEAVLRMVFVNNFVHGDLHPGNILVQNLRPHLGERKVKNRMVEIMDTVILHLKQPLPMRLVFLDCSISSSLTVEDYNKFIGVIRAVVLGKGDEVADLFLRHSQHECRDPEGFKSDMMKLVSTAWHNTISLGTLNLSELMPSVFLLLSKYHVRLDSSFVSVILAMMVVEGLGRSLDPSLDLMEKAKKFIF